jgi:hypothetical protein
MYGFHKVKNRLGTCFNHPAFIKGKHSLLANIKRKNAKTLPSLDSQTKPNTLTTQEVSQTVI